MNDKLVFLQCVPKDDYFIWQLEVQITNFRKFSISDRMEIIVWYPKGFSAFEKWNKIQDKYPEVKFFFYEDDGVELVLYIPQLRPHSFKKHFKEYAERLKDKIFFYHDADIIFNFLPDFDALCEGDVCWESDTSGYLDYEYIVRKEKQGNIPEGEALNKFAEIGHIPVETIRSYSGKTGGAQYILKNIDAAFWEEVERICMDIRRSFFFNVEGSFNRRYFSSENEGFQSWTCDMWAVNFALWNRGMVTDVTHQLDFSWATDSYDTYLKKPIMHNAGATGTQPGVFYKGAWINKSPIGKPLTASNVMASYAYVEAIKAVNNI